MHGSIEFKCCRKISISFPETAEITSSTKRFQNERDTGTEAKDLCSTSSITKLAITADTGDPSKKPHCKFRSPLMKTLDWSVKTLGLDYNSTELCIHLYARNTCMQ